jgi:hypothetical protein
MRKYDPMVAPNGMDFSKSVGNPLSRLERVRSFLRSNGPATKRDILKFVFNKTVPLPGVKYSRYNNRLVTHGWGTYLFVYGVRHGYFTHERKGRTVLWSVTDKA